MFDGKGKDSSFKKRTKTKRGVSLPVGLADLPSGAPLLFFLELGMKRFTETLKWDDPWYTELPIKYKTFWFYICDKCDNAGVWVKNFKLASYLIGEEITEKESLSYFNNGKERIKVIGDRWVIFDFLEFQYGNLSPENHIYTNILRLIEKHNTRGLEGAFKGLRSPYGISKGKGKGNKRGIYKGEIPPKIKDVTNYSKKKKVKESKAKNREYVTSVYPPVEDNSLWESWLGYVDMRIEIKKPLTDRAVKLAAGFLSKYTTAEAKAILDQSVMNNWQGLFPLKDTRRDEKSAWDHRI